jgi:uncharacterized protein (TIGR00369 family)
MSEKFDPNAVAIGMGRGSPHARALGIKTVSVDQDGAIMKIPYDLKLVGDPASGVIAGGAVTALLDHCCGASVHAAMNELKMIATLDLRIDYMRPAEPGKDIFAHATCYKVTRSMCFVRAFAYEKSAEDPVAAAQAVFMITGDRP